MHRPRPERSTSHLDWRSHLRRNPCTQPGRGAVASSFRTRATVVPDAITVGVGPFEHIGWECVRIRTLGIVPSSVTVGILPLVGDRGNASTLSASSEA